jgi:hypothetical protein
MDSLTPAARQLVIGQQSYNPLFPTIFHERWWLDTVTGGNYDEVTFSSGGKVVGRFPFLVRRRIGGRISCEMPALTHFLGPAVDEGLGSAANRAIKRSHIVGELISQLPHTGGFNQRMHRGIQDTMAFVESGYSTSVDFTFEIAPAAQSALWSQMRDKTRNMIRRAQERYEVVEITDPELFTNHYEKNIQERGGRFYYTKQDVARLGGEAITRERGRVIAARAADGSLAAAIFYVWDATSAYYFLSTRIKDSDNSAVSVLLWNAICHANSMGLIFDFDGVASHGSRVFFTGFGGEIRPRYVVKRGTPYYRLSNKLLTACKMLLQA